MTVRALADPDVAPRRRNRERLDPRERCALANLRAVGIEVAERAARAPARDSGTTIAHIAQARGLCRLRRLQKWQRLVRLSVFQGKVPRRPRFIAAVLCSGPTPRRSWLRLRWPASRRPSDRRAGLP